MLVVPVSSPIITGLDVVCFLASLFICVFRWYISTALWWTSISLATPSMLSTNCFYVDLLIGLGAIYPTLLITDKARIWYASWYHHSFAAFIGVYPQPLGLCLKKNHKPKRISLMIASTEKNINMVPVCLTF